MYLKRRFYILLLAVALITGLGYAYAPLYTAGRLLTLLLLLTTVADVALLWHKKAITAGRHLSPRFSNGDDNPVTISVESTYPFPVRVEVIDELPPQFQRRTGTSLSIVNSQFSIVNSLRPASYPPWCLQLRPRPCLRLYAPRPRRAPLPLCLALRRLCLPFIPETAPV